MPLGFGNSEDNFLAVIELVDIGILPERNAVKPERVVQLAQTLVFDCASVDSEGAGE